ncbi:MAG: DUF6077 domain-containing protein [Lachnospiraceae bacterium]|nr:DUF6077 domain-containing protein [Lachnospiraceae bacterium]
MRLEILLTALLFFGGTCLTGYTVRRLLKLKKEGILFSIVLGAMCWWALMELILVPMTMKFASFSSFVTIYSAAVAALSLPGLTCWREIREDLRALIGNWRQYLTLGHLVALLLIVFELWFLHHHMYLEWDDTYYVNLANVAISSDRIYWVYPETGTLADFDKRYVLSLWPIFYAWLSKIFGVAATVMAHTILPWLMIPLAYMVYVLIGKRLFEDDTQLQGMFLAFAILIHLFMSGEHTTGLTFLTITPWVGKGVLAAIVIPTLFYWILRAVCDGGAKNWILLGLTGLAGCLTSSMGIMLTPLFVGLTVLLLALQKKDLRYLVYGILSCLPCILLGLYYIRLTH